MGGREDGGCSKSKIFWALSAGLGLLDWDGHIGPSLPEL